MRRRLFSILTVAVVTTGELATPCSAQISAFPYVQNFDSVQTPALPAGWSATQNRTPGTNDFTSSVTTPRSAPNSVGSTNATISQSLISPLFNFVGLTPDTLTFYTRRSASHNAKMLVEVSLDGGITYPLHLGDSLTNTLPTTYVQTKLPLSTILTSSQAVKFRWRILADVSGNTGTLRIDDVAVSALQPADLALIGVAFQPQLPLEGDSIRAIAKIRNVGQESATGFSAEFYVDANSDSIAQPAELRATISSSLPLAVSDSVDLAANLGQLPPGQQLVIVKVMYPPDQNLSNNQRLAPVVVGYPPRSIVINEIMYAPTGDEPEWVELYNTRGDSINLRNWLVSDNIITSKKIISTQNIFIPSNSFVVMTKDSSGLAAAHPTIRARIINVTGFPGLNNSGDAVVVYDNRVATMDSIAYLPSWGGNVNGYSLERIDPLAPSTSQSNWGTSRNPLRSTPGERNSLTRKNRDLAVDSLRFAPVFPIVGDNVQVLIPVRNIGYETVPAFTMRLFRDANADSIPQSTELISTVTYSTPLLPLDSTVVSMNAGGVLETQFIIAKAGYSDDEDTTNNIRFGRIVVGYPPGSLRINEIMYAPTGTEPEWVEIANILPDTINLKGWMISDNVVTSKHVLTTRNLFIPPNTLKVLTKDSVALMDIHPAVGPTVIQMTSFPTLNNSGDAVVLYDNRAASMDSVAYLPSWGGNVNGFSLERVDLGASSTHQLNWGSSRNPSRSTPGQQNSISRKDRDLVLDSLRISPALPVAGDSLRFTVQVRNSGRQTAQAFTIRLFKDANADSMPQPNELITSVERTVPLSPLDSMSVIISTGITQAGNHVYIVRVDFPSDEDSTNNIRRSRVPVGYPIGVVRINEVMYAPAGGFPEWIELANTTQDTVDIGKWFVGNRSASSRYEITSTALLLPPGEYIVVTKDTALLRTAYPMPEGRQVQVSSLPTFLWNNSGDAVVITDIRRIIMDSVFYRTTWGGTNGKSLERVDLFGNANDSTNWSSSLDTTGATPSRKNSQVRLDNDLRLVRVFADTTFPGQNGHVAMVIQNAGKLPSAAFDIFLYDDVDGDSVGTSSEQFHQRRIESSLAARESLVILAEWIQPASGVHRIIARVEYALDERLSNNISFGIARVGFSPRTLIINEIMYAPFSANAEYVEFYNTSQADIDLANWKFRDRRTSGGTNEFKLATNPKTVRPGEYFVLASDSSFKRSFPGLIDTRLLTILNQSSLSLNNDGDDIVLVDPSGFVIDSVTYLPSWHNPNITDKSGRALEKIFPLLAANDGRNWSTCTLPAGGTPGKANSIFSSTLPPKSRLSVSPNPFSPDGDGREDFTIIEYEMPLTVSTIRARIYDVAGRRIRTLANNEVSGSRGSIVWDGLDDDKQRVRIGVYIILLEAIDDRGGTVETVKTVVVVARPL